MLKITSTSTRVLIAITVAVWIVYDIAAYATGGAKATISTNLWALVFEYPGIGIAIGVLIGHLFFSMPNTPVVVPPGYQIAYFNKNPSLVPIITAQEATETTAKNSSTESSSASSTTSLNSTQPVRQEFARIAAASDSLEFP